LVTTYTALGTSAATVNNLTTDTQRDSRVARLEGDRFLVTWTSFGTTGDGSSTAVKGRIFTATGTPLGTEFLINSNAASEQLEAVCAGLPGGGFVVAWTTGDATQDGSYEAIKAQIFDASGLKIGSEFLVNSLSINSQLRPTVTALATGGFVVGWHTSMPVAGGTFGDVKAQIFSNTGSKIGTEFLVNSITTGVQDWPGFSALSNGNFIATWASGTSDSSDIKAQLFNSNGTKIGTEFGVASAISGGQFGQKAAGLPDGGFVVVWYTSDTTQDGNGYAIKAQFFSAAGAKVGPERLVNTTVAGDQGDPDVAVLADGTVLVSWSQTTISTGVTAGNSAIAAQILDSSGNRIGSEFLIENNTLNLEHSPKIVALSSGGYAAVWDDLRNYGVSLNPDIAFRVYDSNQSPELGAPELSLTMNEGQLIAGLFSASDFDGDTINYSITGGADAARFSINAATGALSFVSAPDFEAPDDTDADNIYQVVISVSDGSLTDTQTLSLYIGNVTEEVVIISNGGGANGQVNVEENVTAITTVVATDPENTPLTYSIIGGADAALFAINETTGTLSFVSAPNYEAPTDAGSNNVYDVIVAASNGVNTDTQAIAVTIADVNEAPVISSNGGGTIAAISVSENGVAVTTVGASDVDGNVLNYSIVGGADSARFAIDSATGALSFIAAPNFEVPDDAGANNVYDVVVQASDGALVDTQSLAVTVTNIANRSYVGTSAANTYAAATAEEWTLDGGGGNDVLTGNASNDTLLGGAGNDRLNGGLGADYLAGGTGSDTYIVDDIGDTVVEAASAGTDVVQSSITYALTTDVENLVLTGTGDINGTGNVLANTLTGNSGNNMLRGNAGADTLNGGAGNDRLIGGEGVDVLNGGAGSDQFVFTAAPLSANRDTIQDFVSGTDQLIFDRNIFTALSGSGTLSPEQFGLGTRATTAAQRLLYNAPATGTTGTLYYDADGSGTGSAAVAIATFTGKPALSASDIFIESGQVSQLIQAMASFGTDTGAMAHGTAARDAGLVDNRPVIAGSSLFSSVHLF
jgi:Ca2+-binding RTX toxin-like protein